MYYTGASFFCEYLILTKEANRTYGFVCIAFKAFLLVRWMKGDLVFTEWNFCIHSLMHLNNWKILHTWDESVWTFLCGKDLVAWLEMHVALLPLFLFHVCHMNWHVWYSFTQLAYLCFKNLLMCPGWWLDSCLWTDCVLDIHMSHMFQKEEKGQILVPRVMETVCKERGLCP